MRRTICFKCLISLCMRDSHRFKPVNDAFSVQEHKSRRDLCRVETRSGLFKFPGFLDVEHEIASINELHHEEESILPHKSGANVNFISKARSKNNKVDYSILHVD